MGNFTQSPPYASPINVTLLPDFPFISYVMLPVAERYYFRLQEFVSKRKM